MGGCTSDTKKAIPPNNISAIRKQNEVTSTKNQIKTQQSRLEK